RNNIMLPLPKAISFPYTTLFRSVEVMKRVQSQMHRTEVAICYGMTETSPVSTQTAIDDPLEKRMGSVGMVHPHIEVKIIDPATGDRKSTRLNSSHVKSSYAVFCL